MRVRKVIIYETGVSQEMSHIEANNWFILLINFKLSLEQELFHLVKFIHRQEIFCTVYKFEIVSQTL